MRAATIMDEPSAPRLQALVEEVDSGRLLIPRFQRPFVWSVEQRFRLLDSVNRGLPIGSVMVWRSSAKEQLECYDELGPFKLHISPHIAGRRSYLMDGLQRVITLYGALRAPTITANAKASDSEDGRWPIYYDLTVDASRARQTEHGFRLLPLQDVGSEPPLSWLPLCAILDPKALYEFQLRLLRSNHGDLARAAERMAARFKDYLVPIIPMVTDDLDLVTEGFRRINSEGTKMSEHHMLRALTFGRPYDVDQGMRRIRDGLVALGWGGMDESVFVEALEAAFDIELQKDHVVELRERLAEQADGSVFGDLLRASVHVVQFLQSCGISSPALLPYQAQFVALMDAARIVGDLRQEPLCGRLTTWFWATTYAEYFADGDAVRRWRAVQHLRDLVTSTDEVDAIAPDLDRYVKPFRHFRAGSARSIAFALLLAEKAPLDHRGEPLDVRALLTARGTMLLELIVPEASDVHPANRFLARAEDVVALRAALLPPPQEPNETKEQWQYRGELSKERADICASHLIEADALEALYERRHGDFLELRAKVVDAMEADAVQKWGLQPASIPRGSSPLRVWRVFVPDMQRAALFENIIRGAGMLPSSGNEPVQKRIDSTWLEAHAYDERGAIDVPRASRVLLDERLRQVTPPASLEDVEPLKIAIATHIRDQIPHPQTALLYGALEPFGTRIDEDGQRILLTSWEARIAQPLTSARDALAARALHDVCFHPKCHPGVAIRAGAIFHFRTGFSVGCEQNGNIWDVDEQVVKAEGPFLTPERTSAPRSNAAESEIHLLVSVSQDVKNGYDKWREETTGRFSEWVHFKPKKGTGRDALDERSVVDGALQVAEAILAIAPPRCVRIFCAGPVAFALALGRTMNTWGNIVTMDYSKMAGTYFESFRFRA